jgi:tight adherence protein B
MALVVFGFFLIMAASFGAVIALTRQTPQQQVVARRMALIHLSVSQQESAHADTAQLFKTIKKSRFRWLDEILGPYRFSQTAQILILQANSSTTVAGLILTSVGLFLGGYFVAWLFIKLVLVDIAGGVALCLLPYLIINFKRSRRVAAFNAGLAEAIDMLARALRAGHSADLRVLVTAILVQKDTGGNLAEILDRTVFVIRERLRIQGEIQVQTAQGRLTGWILSALPVVMMVLLNVVNPGYSSILFHDPLGRKLLYGSIAMLIAGSFIIRRIINAIEV